MYKDLRSSFNAKTNNWIYSLKRSVVIILTAISLCIVAPAQAVSISIDFLTALPAMPAAPIEFTPQSANLNINSGGAGEVQIGTITFDPGTNVQPMTTTAMVYEQISVNGTVYPVGNSTTIDGLAQDITYARTSTDNYIYANAGKCITCDYPVAIDVGTTLGTTDPAKIIISLIVSAPVIGPTGIPLDATPLTLPITARFELMVTQQDADSDGISDTDELALGTDPNDADTDDDGLSDGQEDGSLCSGVSTDPLLADTDNDGIQDGTECSLTIAQGADTDISIFQPDGDSSTSTNPVDGDSDDDGILDGNEDSNSNGILDFGETDPNNTDTDNDGLQDGTEIGLSVPQGSDTDYAVFIADSDTTTITNPTNPDTDGDGLLDGSEDSNHNGYLDSGETDPLTADTTDEPPTDEPPVSTLTCLEYTDMALKASRAYQKATRGVTGDCGRKSNTECTASLQSQQNTFEVLELRTLDVQQNCVLTP